MTKPVVLITGALTGIGRATALAFAREGAKLVVSGRRDEEGLAPAKVLSGPGAEVEFVKADVRKEADVRNLVDQAVDRFGRIDVAVNNAGTEGQPGPLTEQSAPRGESRKGPRCSPSAHIPVIRAAAMVPTLMKPNLGNSLMGCCRSRSSFVPAATQAKLSAELVGPPVWRATCG